MRKGAGKRKKILCVFGTRPEAIKMAPVVLELQKHPGEFHVQVVVTAQHRQMLDQVMGLFGLKSDHDLNIMKDGQTLTGVSLLALERLEPVLKKERPDLVLVHGDTTTALIAALASFYHNIPVGHVEAGLRSGDFQNPYPEEMNRRLVDALCALHFAPTPSSRLNLLKENISPKGVFVTGNTGIDALHLGLNRLKAKKQGRRTEGIFPLPLAGEGGQGPGEGHIGDLILVTAHRRENFGQPLRDIFGAFLDVARRRPDVRFVYPVHPNPNVKGPARELLSGQSNIHLLPPLDYGEFLPYLERAKLVVTDSGGLQEEAPSLGKPVLVLRRVTERPEAVRAGTVKIVGTRRAEVRRWILRLLDDRAAYKRMAGAVNPYGDGRAAHRTVEAIRFHFGFRATRPKPFTVT